MLRFCELVSDHHMMFKIASHDCISNYLDEQDLVNLFLELNAEEGEMDNARQCAILDL